jgi:hypothetical protein
MEEQLRDLVRTNGFEPVFTTLKTLVTNEYERAKRDWDFLQTLIKQDVVQDRPEVKNEIVKPEVVLEEEETKEEEEVVEIDTKKISISDGSGKMKLPIRRKKTA